MRRKPKTRRDPHGAWLHHLRTEKRLTQHQLSALSGIHQRTIAHWERTGKLTGRKPILALSKIFGVSVNKLLRPDK